MEVDVDTRCTILNYLKLIKRRASGTVYLANGQRQFDTGLGNTFLWGIVVAHGISTSLVELSKSMQHSNSGRHILLPDTVNKVW